MHTHTNIHVSLGYQTNTVNMYKTISHGMTVYLVCCVRTSANLNTYYFLEGYMFCC